MSAPAADPSRLSYEKSIISDNFNSTVLFTFLMGLYTIVYFGTLILYLTRKGSQRRVVILSITLLYMLGVINLGVQWYELEWIVVLNGETRESIFIATLTLPGWSVMLDNFCLVYMVVIADGLLVWRCFFVWNRSLLLCLAETVICGKNAAGILPLKIQILGNTIESALFFTSLSSSLLATLLIAFRIHSVSKQDGGSRGRFGHIIEIVVQSAAVYSLASLIMGVVLIVPRNSAAMNQFVNYGMAVAFTLTGIGPTIMIARVCLAADPSTQVSTIHNLSGLQFQGRSTRQNATQIMLEDAPEMNVEVAFTDKVTGTV
ncbi:hypothetical protein GALMADRAFT_144030 [Galerina marginata CBS 339.88]|uniref:Uncharacterized protein n=1 Tax=Galerina marginata (strain CBS 339.88) TaxID=685588 RepID=A0A067SX43_GALM3|nr:hypothetical protein GALMADRAFT_144030 [Galerina marginata CBS 339.88]